MNLNATLFVQLAVFFVLSWVTMKFIWPPLIAAIDERRKKIAEGLASAEKADKIEVPPRAQRLRVIAAELQRVASHCLWLGTWCMDMGGALGGGATIFLYCIRERELVLDLFELITGLRMNHAFIRPGGVAQDLPPGALDEIRAFIALMKKRLPEYAALCNANPIFKARLEGVGHLDLEGCLALGLTGPVLRSTGYPWDLRKTSPYCGYETYDFDVQTWDTADSYGRFRVRLNEMWESLRIVEQAADRLARM